MQIKKVEKDKLKTGIIIRNFMILSIILLLVISSSKLPFSLYIPGMPFLDTVAFVGPIIICVLILIANGVLKLDIISILLLARIVFAFLTIISRNVSIYSAIKSMLIFIIALTAYLIFKHIAKFINNKEFGTFINVYVAIIAVQTIGIYIISYLDGAIFLKNSIQIPIGNSNFIAANILLGLVFLIFNKPKSKLNIIIIIIGLISLLFTFSFGALISLAIIFLIMYLKKLNKRNYMKTILILALIIFSLIGLYFFYLNYSYSSDKAFDGINRNISMKVNYLHEGSFERLFSGRLIIFERAIDNFTDNILLGSYYGIEFRDTSDFKTHNLFLEALSSYGILGFLTFIIPIFLIMKKIRGDFKNSFEQFIPFYLALLVGVIQGLIEPNFFTLSFEFVWWSIAGYGVGNLTILTKSRDTRRG